MISGLLGKRIITRSSEETFRFGARLARDLTRGMVIGLIGELGTGKTCMIQGICSGLKVRDFVTSPSFVMINEYLGRALEGSDLWIYHFDLYRLRDFSELLELGCEEYFYGDGICLIEWAERAGELLPEDALKVHLSYLSEAEREIAVVLNRRTQKDDEGRDPVRGPQPEVRL